MTWTRHIYRSHDGIEVAVVCPWGAQSGHIPPPAIDFTGANIVFVYIRTDRTEAGS
jgi:hypothetical protein